MISSMCYNVHPEKQIYLADIILLQPCDRQPVDHKLLSMLLQPVCKALQVLQCFAVMSFKWCCNALQLCHLNNELKRNAKIMHIHTP